MMLDFSDSELETILGALQYQSDYYPTSKEGEEEMYRLREKIRAARAAGQLRLPTKES